jgi:hypothetical protein
MSSHRSATWHDKLRTIRRDASSAGRFPADFWPNAKRRASQSSLTIRGIWSSPGLRMTTIEITNVFPAGTGRGRSAPIVVDADGCGILGLSTIACATSGFAICAGPTNGPQHDAGGAEDKPQNAKPDSLIHIQDIWHKSAVVERMNGPPRQLVSHSGQIPEILMCDGLLDHVGDLGGLREHHHVAGLDRAGGRVDGFGHRGLQRGRNRAVVGRDDVP